MVELKAAPVIATVVESGPLLGLIPVIESEGECLEQAVNARVANNKPAG